MLEKFKHVSNPLTIIAIFAGIVEISGIWILPNVSDPQQGLYIGFLVLFPPVLVVAFFITLNFNHKVLYSPSDFSDDANFLKAMEANKQVDLNASKLEKKLDELGTIVLDAVSNNANQEEAFIKSLMDNFNKVRNQVKELNKSNSEIIKKATIENSTVIEKVYKYLCSNASCTKGVLIHDLKIPEELVTSALQILLDEKLISSFKDERGFVYYGASSSHLNTSKFKKVMKNNING